MKIYTTYFANIGKMPESIVPVSITVFPPKGYTGLQYKDLAPTPDLLRRWKLEQDEEYYEKTFSEKVLNHCEAKKVFSDLQSLSGGKDVALVCYEKPSDFCHRHLVARWLTESGFECIEYRN